MIDFCSKSYEILSIAFYILPITLVDPNNGLNIKTSQIEASSLVFFILRRDHEKFWKEAKERHNLGLNNLGLNSVSPYLSIALTYVSPKHFRRVAVV